MKDHPMMFRPEMVRAVLADFKWQTRRAIKRRNTLVDGSACPKGFWPSLDFTQARIDRGPSPAGNVGPYLHVPCPSQETVHRIYPRIQPGDRIWVKERMGWGVPQYAPAELLYYHADESPVENIPGDAKPVTHKACPSMFMPRWASRILLEVLHVYPQRTHDIIDDEVRAEGICEVCESDGRYPGGEDEPDWICGGRGGVGCQEDVQALWRGLWESINGKGPFNWQANTWNWAYQFKRLES